ncbi:MAG: hypothetical protein K6F09_01890 [Clostridiales bacterium]|nr:hypothetical protein [Clostridiales bacterium]
MPQDKTLEELGREYADIAKRLKEEVAVLKKKRRNTSVWTTAYYMLSEKITQKQELLDEVEDIAYRLIHYYEKET